MKDEADLPISGAEITVAARATGAIRRMLRRPEPATVLKRRAEVRNEMRENLQWPKRDPAPEVLIVNHRRYDKYGELDTRLIGRGASDWFKAEVKELHDRGLEIYSSIEYVVVRRGKARRVSDETIPGARKVWIVGRIPYERITFMDWAPDPGYGAPRFYVVYDWRREPYREVVLYEGSPDDYPYEMDGVKYKGEGGGPINRLRRFIQRVRFNVRDRRNERRWRKERYDSK